MTGSPDFPTRLRKQSFEAVAHPVTHSVLHLEPTDRRSAEGPRLAGFPLRVVTAKVVEEEILLGIGGARLRVGDHAAHLYWTAEERIRGLVAAVTESLRAGDRLVYVVNDVPVAAFERALVAAGIDAAARAAEGRLALVAAEDVLFHGGLFEPSAAQSRLRALLEAGGARRTRLFVDMTYLLANVPGIERGLELEAGVGEALRGLPFVRICAFDGAREMSDRLADVLRMHPKVIGEGGLLLNPYYRPWNELRTVRRAGHLGRPLREAK